MKAQDAWSDVTRAYALSDADLSKLEAELLEAGADDYVEKSVDADRFMARVHAVLRRAL